MKTVIVSPNRWLPTRASLLDRRQRVFFQGRTSFVRWWTGHACW